jgi:hypothetical protein
MLFAQIRHDQMPLDLALAANGVANAVEAIADDPVDAPDAGGDKDVGELICNRPGHRLCSPVLRQLHPSARLRARTDKICDVIVVGGATPAVARVTQDGGGMAGAVEMVRGIRSRR